MCFTLICMAFHSYLETDYDPDNLDYYLEMQYLLSGKLQSKNNYLFGKLMNQKFFFVIWLLSQNMKFSFGFFWLERESKLIQITSSIFCQQYFLNYCMILSVRQTWKKWRILMRSGTTVFGTGDYYLRKS